ncbi:MAG: HAMP domain-containing histidine kinase [Helicobacter sp.]|nr:HAMP domain-containing histidine kinase [Helicobacter sp.]
MSIFRQILLLVVLSCAIILILFIKSEQLLDERDQSLQLNQILNDVRPLYLALMKGDIVRVKDGLAKKGYHIKLGGLIPLGAQILYSENSVFGKMVIWSREREYGLLLAYLDDVILASLSTRQDFWENYGIHLLLGAQLLVMLAFYIILYLILRPIKSLTRGIKHFESGDYNIQIPIRQNNELGALAESFNHMATKIASLLRSKELLLRSAGHELRTPIAKGKLALEIMQDTKEKPMLKACFDSLEHLTNHLLTFEYLQGVPLLKKEQFFAQTLVFEALLASFADEDSATLELRHDFAIIGDKEWLAVALKNLIDNALKYREGGAPIVVCVQENRICVRNKGKPLEGDFALYTDPFVRGEQQTMGYGLGLSIVRSILELHHLTLGYCYENGEHCLSIEGFKNV